MKNEYEQVAEFSIRKDVKLRLFRLFKAYCSDGVSWDYEGNFNRMCLEHPHLEASLGFDICWSILFGDYPGNYFRAPHLKRRRYQSSKITNEEWSSLQERYSHSCFYCGHKAKRLTKDHVVAMSKGGSDTIDNIVPACWPCNRKKNAKAVAVFRPGVTLKLL